MPKLFSYRTLRQEDVQLAIFGRRLTLGAGASASTPGQPVIFAREEPTMTIIITAFERSPDGGKGLAVIRAFAGRSKKWGNPTRFALFRSGR
jgi:hypothetical protein